MSDNTIWSSVRETRVWRVYIDDMDEPSDHLQRIDLIRQASPGDEINLFISCYGGRVSVLERYAAAIRASQARIITHAIGGVQSAGVSLWLHGHEKVIDPEAHFMVHNVQSSYEGDFVNIKRASDFYAKEYRRDYETLYSQILSQEEIDGLLDSAVEVYISAEEMQERLEGRILGHMPDPAELVAFPFPSTAKSVYDFEVKFNSGDVRVFNLLTLSQKDFIGLTTPQLVELAKEFNIEFGKEVVSDRYRVAAIINAMRKGVN